MTSKAMSSVAHRIRSRISRYMQYVIEPINPTVATRVGERYYRRRSSWGLHPELCACDLQLTDYLEQREIEGKSVFHFGSGSHHHVGVRCAEVGKNEVLAVTASIREHKTYSSLILKRPALAKLYKLLFVDIYTLTPRSLPDFDVAALFHICEFSEAPAPGQADPDEVLVAMFLEKMRPNGMILFYTGSFGWSRGQGIVDSLVQRGALKHLEDFEQLAVYAVSSASGDEG